MRDHIKTIHQGHRGVAEYTKEFRDLACQLTNWPQDILISCFKDGLNNDIYNISRGASSTLHGLYILAKEVEIDQVYNVPPRARVKEITLREERAGETAEPTATLHCLLQVRLGGASGGRVQNWVTHQELNC